MSKGLYVTVFGAGGSMLDPAGGMRTISQKCAARGLVGQLEPYNYTDTAMVDWIKSQPADLPLFLIGDSCGANRLPWIADAIAPRKVTGMFPVQASIYCNAGCPTIGANVENALIIYSDWAHTGGLGVFIAQLAEMPTDPNLADGGWHLGNKGHTRYKQLFVPAPHPDDNDVAGVQDPIFSTIDQLLAAAA